jgi:hypothetical protein
VQSLCLDFYWFPDDNPGWLDRLIEARLGGVVGQAGGEADAGKMRAAAQGLLALAQGFQGRRELRAPSP